MKTKIKDIASAQKQGLGGVKQLLKKTLKEPITEPEWFFYDSEFDYAGKDGKQPLLYIGKRIAPWKLYAKDNKQSKTFVAGLCTSSENGELQLLAKMGKGAKPMVLKAINKVLLKPFAQATFVESLEGEESAPAPSANELDVAKLENEVNTLLQPATEAQQALTNVISNLQQPLSNISDTIVSDKLVQDVKQGLQTIAKYELSSIVGKLNTWLTSAPQAYPQPEAQPYIQKVQTLYTSLQQLQAPMEMIVKNGQKVEKVQNPTESTTPPISSDPLRNLATFLQGTQSGTPLDTAVSSLKK